MDVEVAEWLSELIHQSVMEIEHGSGLTIEIDEHPENWLQIVPETDSNKVLSGFLMNFPYRTLHEDPLERLYSAGIKPPPGTSVTSVEGGAYATLLVRPDIPLIAFALFAADILEKIGGAEIPYEVSVQMMHGL
jgi:hypothetical protein